MVKVGTLCCLCCMLLVVFLVALLVLQFVSGSVVLDVELSYVEASVDVW